MDIATAVPEPGLATRLRTARRDSALTQQEAAARLGIARTTLVAMEKGERSVRPNELIALAQLYGRPVNELLRPTPMPDDFLARFRLRGGQTASEVEVETTESVIVLQRLADDYRELERLTDSPPPRAYLPERSVLARRPTVAGQSVADSERRRLGLGDGPVYNLRDVFEAAAAARIFIMRLPTAVSGLFIQSDALGTCVAVNAKHRPERQRMTLAHEYAHFLDGRGSTEITLQDDVRRRHEEIFANSFAQNFLLPESGLTRRFLEIEQSNDHVTPADLVRLADLFQVSVEALVRRLEDLGLIRSGTWDHLVAQGFAVEEARRLLGLERPDLDEPELPLRYRLLAIRAFADAKLSEGELARFLRVDRTAARAIAQELDDHADIGLQPVDAVPRPTS